VYDCVEYAADEFGRYCVKKEVVEPSEIEVVLGRIRLSASGGEKIAVAEIKPHESYDWKAKHNDIALLRLNDDSNQPPVHVANWAIHADLLTDGSEAFIAGWGDIEEGSGAGSDDLLFGKLTLRPDGECQEGLGERYDSESSVCAIGEGNEDTCQGDSGGPLLVWRLFAWVLAGATSWGHGCGRGVPGAYADPAADSMREFIESTLTRDGLTPPAAPSDLQTDEVTRERVEIHWDENATNESSLFIHVGLLGSGIQAKHRINANTDSQAFSVPADSAGSYVFAVMACNEAGCSEWSNDIVVTPEEQ
jgi:hypothetical protein